MAGADEAFLRMVEHLEALTRLGPELEAAIHARDVPAVYAVEHRRVPHTRGFSEARNELLLHGSPTATIAPQLSKMKALATQERATVQLLDFFKADVATTRDRWPQWVGNSLANGARLTELPSADVLRGCFAGRPAVLVSAGPSLEKNLHLLADVEDRMVVIAVNRSVAMMTERGIRADITVVTDSLERVSVQHLQTASVEATPTLVGRPSLDPAFFEAPCARRFLYSDHSPHELFLADLAQVRLPTFPAASVAHVGLQLAAYMGCPQIVLIGQDLALRDGAMYGEMDPDRAAGEGHTHQTLTVPAYGGGEAVTTPVLATFLRSFEVLVGQLDRQIRVVNATEGGAAIAGTEERTLQEAIDELAGETFDVQATLAEAHEGGATGSAESLEAGLEQCRAHLRTLMDECGEPESLDGLLAALAPVAGLMDPPLLPRWVEALAPLYATGVLPKRQAILEASAQALFGAADDLLERL